MLKNYFYIILFFLCFTATNAVAQEGKSAGKTQESIVDLSVYPNPVSNGKIYITSKSSADKLVTIFDVLGKKVLQTQLTSKELNVSTLSPGVYIIKVEEGDASATRKLIVR
ncbi:MAG: T9SS type A sorting domain-containing protein [Flavobacteriales bacterium]|nr:T9SS type A sorting domain-containing protein [Flavobacteriales bacterium]